MFTLSKDQEHTLLRIRRTLHRHPELAFQEKKTAALVEHHLKELGIPCQTGLGRGTGIRAELGKGTGPCMALRADMDALPVLEETGLDFASQQAGVMHACGHDGHTAMLLGAAELLTRSRIIDEIGGRVVLLFQPAEEAGTGAPAMIADNCLQDVAMIFSGHIDTHHPVGYLAVDQGVICSYADPFLIEIHGQGGHAARPHEAIDAVMVAADLVLNIQTMVSRMIDPARPGVITVGRIAAGAVHNVIADKAVLEGTIRSTHPDTRARIISRMQGVVRGLEEMCNAEISFTLQPGLPAVINDPVSCAIARQAAQEVVGDERVVSQGFPSLGGEDFSFYQQKIPGTLIRFGAAKKSNTESNTAGPSHSGSFDFDEKVLVYGSQWLTTVAVHALQHLKKS
ncbi:M20 metallopeptidase family protein [Candidatus Electrothrix sp.]|uniref:M20 metallopeptidase family protein n=1 Tax=Candidatus Electrothrix sp. TaxID=2170559 RepID=UPI00405784DB